MLSVLEARGPCSRGQQSSLLPRPLFGLQTAIYLLSPHSLFSMRVCVPWFLSVCSSLFYCRDTNWLTLQSILMASFNLITSSNALSLKTAVLEVRSSTFGLLGVGVGIIQSITTWYWVLKTDYVWIARESTSGLKPAFLRNLELVILFQNFHIPLMMV